MASFDIAYLPTQKIEGGYSNDKDDTGGQTVFGLTRRDWPNWGGWHVIDTLIHDNGLTKAIPMINANKTLKDSVTALFKANYWQPLLADQINDQQVANQAYDTAINMGVGIAAKFLQQVAGVTVDLHVGPKTIAAINAINGKDFFNKFIALRKARYDAIIAADPTQEKFKASWYSRLKPYIS